jgi:hypothetical protein
LKSTLKSAIVQRSARRFCGFAVLVAGAIARIVARRTTLRFLADPASFV